MRRRVATLLLFLTGPLAQAQAVSGSVTDAETGEPLAGANIAVLDDAGAVVGGASTNAEGAFSLRPDAFPARLAVRYIGYRTERLTLAEPTDGLRIALQPDVGALGEVTVTPGEDPAVALMRRVIARTRAGRAALGPYAVTAYARSTIRAPGGDVKGITEAITDAYWAPGDGWREVVVSSRRTENLGAGGVSGGIAEGLLDLLAADVEVSGHRLVGPTHPDALGVYRFEIVGSQALDGRLVVEVALAPRRATASAFVGTLQVLFDSADVLAADLAPGPSFLFPPPIQVTGARFQQQYVPVAADSSLWLPADLRSTFALGFNVDGLLSSDPFTIERAAQLSGYRLGAIAPDSLRALDGTLRATRLDSARLVTPGVAVPLTDAEAEAYAAGDSLGSVEEVLVLRGPLAPLARQGIRVSGGREAAPDSTVRRRPAFAVQVEPLLAANYGETLRLGAAVPLRVAALRLEPSAAFRLADRGVSLGVEAWHPVARFEPGERARARLRIVGGMADGVARRLAPSAPEGVLPLGGRGGYYASKRASGGLAVEVDGLGTIRDGGFVQFDVEAEASLRLMAETAATYAPGEPPAFDGNALNLGAGERTVRSLRLDAALGTLDEPLGLLPRRAFQVMAEWAPPLLGTDADFWRADAVLEARIPTFGRRRVLPAALDLRLSGGLSGGALPAFRRFALGNAVGGGALGLTTFGALRAKTGLPEAGERYALLAWEHSFRTLPFEALGVEGLTRRAYNVIVHGAHGRTWGGPEAMAEAHHEVGVSLSGVLGALRLDLTQRLDRPATVVGVGVARAF